MRHNYSSESRHSLNLSRNCLSLLEWYFRLSRGEYEDDNLLTYCCCSCRWGETVCKLWTGWCMSMERHGGMMSTRKNSCLVHQSSLAILPAESYGNKQQERAKGMINMALRSIFVHTCKWFFFHAIKSYDTGSPALLPSEGRSVADFYFP
jgi:hypothetical protein